MSVVHLSDGKDQSCLFTDFSYTPPVSFGLHESNSIRRRLDKLPLVEQSAYLGRDDFGEPQR